MPSFLQSLWDAFFSAKQVTEEQKSDVKPVERSPVSPPEPRSVVAFVGAPGHGRRTLHAAVSNTLGSILAGPILVLEENLAPCLDGAVLIVAANVGVVPETRMH